MHNVVGEKKDSSMALSLIWQGMDIYLKQNPIGKILHDPLAACCALDSTLGTWREVELFRDSGEWGARLSPGSNTWIIIDYDHQRFLECFLDAT
jgi:pyrimidine-specific ribonucleoside hydrolase